MDRLSIWDKALLDRLLASGRDYFENTLKVRKTETLQFVPSCDGPGWYSNETIVCWNDCVRRCGPAYAPRDAQYYANCICHEKPCATNQTNWGGRLHNVDFVLFVSIIDEECPSERAYGTAAHCYLDHSTYRPIAGFMNICPRIFKRMKQKELDDWRAAIKHEWMHALGFSSQLFKYFPGARTGDEYPMTFIC